MVFEALTAEEVDVKSPIDDRLMGKIKEDLDDLNTRVVAAGSSPFNVGVIGRLSFLNTYPQKKSLDGIILSKEFTPTYCRYGLKKSGLSGLLTFDLRKATSPKTPITGIANQYEGATTSVGRAGTGLSTQSISNATPVISTQSITFAKAAVNIQSIVPLGVIYGLGSNVTQVNLSAQLDSDVKVGDSIIIASATSGGNNGTFVITAKNRGGGNNITFENASAVLQTGAAGTVQPTILSYNFTNPVSATFTAGYAVVAGTHTSGANDGVLTIYDINRSGNNIWIKNPTGVTQGSPAGTVASTIWQYNFAGAASTTDYVIGEQVFSSGHTNGVNDSTGLLIFGVNVGGNNILLYNTSGVAQAGVAGTINTKRWIYGMPTDPSTDVQIGDTVYLSGHTSSVNDGLFTVKQVNRGAINNVVVYNSVGVTQGSAAGLLTTNRKLVKFASDQSAFYTTNSYVELDLCPATAYNSLDSVAPFKVLQINRGGGANYNIVIQFDAAPTQLIAGGYVKTEMKSIFTTAPTITATNTNGDADVNLTGFSTAFDPAQVIPNLTPILLYVNNQMTGDPRDLSVSIL